METEWKLNMLIATLFSSVIRLSTIYPLIFPCYIAGPLNLSSRFFAPPAPLASATPLARSLPSALTSRVNAGPVGESECAGGSKEEQGTREHHSPLSPANCVSAGKKTSVLHAHSRDPFPTTYRLPHSFVLPSSVLSVFVHPILPFLLAVDAVYFPTQSNSTNSSLGPPTSWHSPSCIVDSRGRQHGTFFHSFGSLRTRSVLGLLLQPPTPHSFSILGSDGDRAQERRGGVICSNPSTSATAWQGGGGPKVCVCCA